MASSGVPIGELETDFHERLDRQSDVVPAARLLSYLEDDVNRCFLNLASIEWRTAQELTEICGTPLSTTYRKLNELDDAGLLDQRIRVNADGKHPEEYRSKPMLLTFRMGNTSGLEISVSTASESGENYQ